MFRNKIRRMMVITCVVGATVVTEALPSGASGRVVIDKQDGLTFSLPAKWSQVPLNGNDFLYFLNQAAIHNPALKSAITTEVKQMAKQGAKIFAVGPYQQNFLSNINVIVVSSAGAPTGQAFFTAAQAQLKVQLTSAGFKDLKFKVASFPFGKALEGTYRLGLTGQAKTVHGLQLYILHKSRIAIVTFTSLSPTTDLSVATTVGRSWHWT